MTLLSGSAWTRCKDYSLFVAVAAGLLSEDVDDLLSEGAADLLSPEESDDLAAGLLLLEA